MVKTKPKPKRFPPQVVQALPVSEESCSNSTEELEQQFEVELYWCIHQLQNALNSGKLNPKQIQDHTKALNVLMSKSAPIVQKRQVMRLSFGDYRSKMAVEEKKLTKVNMQIKLSPAKPSSKSIFVKKCNGFKFDFEIPETNESIDIADVVVEKKSCVKIGFAPSDNNFKFNFEVNE